MPVPVRVPAAALLALSLSALPVSAQAAEVLELVETAPVETTLDSPDLRDTHVVWPEMIDRATKTLEFAEFYASDEPGSRLEAVLQAIERATARGVRVRFLSDKRFEKTYPDTLARLGKMPNAQVRIIDVGALSGGVLHAKYFVVDGREMFVGSQNFDWRALQHILEMGVRLAEPDVVRAYQDVFETDWALAAPGADKTFRARTSSAAFPARIGTGEDAPAVTPVFSPKGWLPDEKLWDLPHLVEMIDGAKSTVRVQLLTYKTISRDGSYFDVLESALRRAAARKVSVQLLLADWSKSKGNIEGLQSLQSVPGIDVRMSTIPQWSGGFIPFARVGHAKYLVVDGKRSWIGTGNWEGDYFHQSRNAGLVIDSPAIGGRLDRFFENAWGSTYAYDVDPCKTYEPARVAE